MRSSVAFALISLNVVSWATIAAADDQAQGVNQKRNKIMTSAPRQVDTTHGVSTTPDRTGAVGIANLGAGVGAAAGTVQPTVLTAAASSVGAGAVVAGGRGATVTTFKAGSYAASIVTMASASTRIEPTSGGTGSVTTLRTGTDRTGALATYTSMQTGTVQPTGTGATGGNFVMASVRPETVIQQTGVGAGGTFSAVAGWRAGVAVLESLNVRATFVEVPAGGIVTRKPGGVTPRAVGIWNSATSMVDPVQRIKPVRKSR